MKGLPANLGMLIRAGSVWSRGTAADEAAAPACVSGTRASCRQIPPAFHLLFPFSCSAGREFMRNRGCAWWRHAQNVWNNKPLTSTRGPAPVVRLWMRCRAPAQGFLLSPGWGHHAAWGTLELKSPLKTSLFSYGLIYFVTATQKTK